MKFFVHSLILTISAFIIAFYLNSFIILWLIPNGFFCLSTNIQNEFLNSILNPICLGVIPLLTWCLSYFFNIKSVFKCSLTLVLSTIIGLLTKKIYLSIACKKIILNNDIKQVIPIENLNYYNFIIVFLILGILFSLVFLEKKKSNYNK